MLCLVGMSNQTALISVGMYTCICRRVYIELPRHGIVEFIVGELVSKVTHALRGVLGPHTIQS